MTLPFVEEEFSQAREFAPETGRFISRDPRKENIGNPLTLNRYIYVKNNPVNHIDPKGLGDYEDCMNECLKGPRKARDKCIAYWGKWAENCALNCDTVCLLVAWAGQQAYEECVATCIIGCGSVKAGNNSLHVLYSNELTK